MKIFDYEGPVLSFFSKMLDLLILNMLTLLFSIPIITIGASVTAAHYTALKLHRGEGHVWSCFWKSFKVNIGQSTGIWMILVICCVVSAVTYSIAIYMSGTLNTVVRGVVIAVLILIVFLYVWVFPLQSRFINPVRTTFKNVFFLMYKYFFRTLLMVLFNMLPVGTFSLVVYVFHMHGMGIWLLFGVSVPIYWCAMTYNSVFEELEEMA